MGCGEFFVIFLACVFTFYCAEGSFVIEGCYDVNVASRVFTTSAGDYDPNTIDHAQCVEACATLDYQYAALTGGRYCLCGDNTYTGSTSAGCTTQCSGNAAETCGGHRSETVLQVQIQRAAVQLNSTNDVFVVGQSQSLEPDITGTAVTSSFDYGDGSPATVYDASVTRNHVYAVPGQYVASIHTQNSVSGDFAAAQVTVYMDVGTVTLDCPETADVAETFTCSVTVEDGSDLELTTNIGISYHIGTPNIFAVGTASQDAVGSNPALTSDSAGATTVWVLPGLELLSSGTIRSVEVNAAVAGTIKLLLLRPTCAADSYCLTDNQCSASCDYDVTIPTNPIYHSTCDTGSSEYYCLTQHRCVTAGTCPDPPNRYETAAGTTPRSNYVVIDIISVTLVQGYNYHEVAVGSRTAIGEIGNVIGFEVTNGGAQVYYESAGSGVAAAFEVVTAAAVSSTLTPTINPVGKTFQIRVTAIESLSASFEHSFDSVGIYTLSATANNSNDAVGQMDTTQIVVAVPIVNLVMSVSLHPGSTYFEGGDIVNFTVSIDAGDPIELVIEWGDGNITTFVDMSAPIIAMPLSHLYDLSSGVVTVTMTASNAHSNETVTEDLFFQNPVLKEHYLITPDSPAVHPYPDISKQGYINITVELLDPQAKPYGTTPNITFSSSFYDNSTHSMHLSSEGDIESFTHPVQFPGSYNVLVTIKNHVSEVVFNVKVELYSEISPDIYLDVLFQPEIPKDGDPVPGYGPSGLDLPLENPIVFKPTMSSGSSVFFEYLDMVPIENSTEETFRTTYGSPGVKNMTVRASNPVSGPFTFNRTFHLYETIYGIDITTGEITIPGQPKRFDITIVQVGYESCLAITFEEHSTPVLYGVPACNGHSKYPNGTYNGTLSNSITEYYTYMNNGSYEFIVNGFNLVTDVTVKEPFAVTYLQCNVPEVSIDDAHPFRNDPKRVKVYEYMYFTAKTNIRCVVTTDNFKTWVVREVNQTSGEEIAGGLSIDLTEVENANTANIGLRPYTYPPGFYRFTYCVTMDQSQLDDIVFEACVDEFVEVLSYELEAKIVDGQLSSTTIGFDQLFRLAPETYSKDPSVPPDTADQGITVFEYYCKRFYEEFRLHNDKTLDDTAIIIADVEEDNGGCFGTGAGRLNHSEGILDLNTAWMNANMTYDILVVIKKGSVTGSVSCQLKVVPGDPPQPVITVADGTTHKVGADSTLFNPTAGIGLRASCSASCTDVTYEFEIDYHNGSNYLPLNGWEVYATGINSNAFKVSKEFFELEPTATSYSFRLLATGNGGATGVTEMIAGVNAAPKDGACTVHPLNITLGDSVKVSCTGWTDDERVASYEFIVSTSLEDEGTPLRLSSSNTAELPLPASTEADDYRVGVLVVVYDEMGAGTAYDVGYVVVDPGELAETILDDSSIEETITAYEELTAEGNPQEIVQRTFVDISALNIDRQNTNTKIDSEISTIKDTEIDSANETATTISSAHIQALNSERLEKTSKRAFVRNQLAAVQAQVQLNSYDEVLALGGPTVELSKATDELSQGTLNSLSTVMANMLATTEEQKDGVSTETQTAASALMAEICGNIFEGSADVIQGSLPIFDQLEYAGQTSYSDLQAQLSSATSSSGDQETTTEWTEEDSALLQQKKEKAKEVVQNATANLARVKSLLSKNLLPGEEAIRVSKASISLSIQRDAVDVLTDVKVEEDTGSVKLPTWCELQNTPEDQCDQSAVIDLQTTSLPKNPNNYDDSSERVSEKSGVMDIIFQNLDGSKIDITDSAKPIQIVIKMPTAVEPEWGEFGPEDLVSINATSFNVSYHAFVQQYNDTSTAIQLRARNSSCYAMLLQFGGGFPNFTHFDDAYLFYYGRDATTSDDEYIIHQVLINGSTAGAGTHRIMLLELDCDVLYRDYPDLTFADPFELVWAAGNTSRNFSENYGFRVINPGCNYWSEAEERFKQDGCRVTDLTNDGTVTCSCTHLTSFTNTWVVPPTPLDFDYIFNNAGFVENLTIYAVTITIYVLFFFIFLWSRRRDRKDLFKLGVTPLADNNPRHNYYYEIVVLTGQRKAAGTDSKVNFILSGENDETEVRDFDDDKRKIFRRGASDRFLMAVPGPLGTLNYMRIWHDNSGKGKMQGWYAKYIAIRDVQTRERFYFIVNQWFSVVEDDGQIDRLVPVAGREQMQDFSHLFANHSRKNFNDGHLWFSIFARPPGSRFTRLQRAASCLMLLWLEMLTNIMWYKTAPPPVAKNPIDIGPMSLSPAQISIGIQANLIVFPVSLLVVQFFRKSRPRKKRESRLKVAALSGKSKLVKRFKPRASRKAAYSTLEEFASPSRIMLEEGHSTMMRNPAAGTRAEPSLVIPPIPGAFDESTVRGGGYPGGDSPSPPPPPGSGDAAVLIQSDKPKRRKKFSFPWWFVIVAWLLVILTTAAATTFTVFYGIQFGDQETKEFLASLFVSFFTGLVLTQPIKILLIAVFVACVIKSPNADEDAETDEDEEDFELNEDEEYLHTISGDVNRKKKRKLPYKPPDPEAIERARVQRQKEIKMYSIFREIFFYIIYLWVVLMISYGNSDPYAYRMQEDFVNELVDGDGVASFSKVGSHAGYWNYLHKTLVPALFPQTWYNGANRTDDEKGFLAAQNAYVIGYAVIRQIRVKPDLCDVVSEFEATIPECNVKYSFGDEDQRDYGPGWVPPNATYARTEFNYTEPEDIDSYPIMGRHAIYRGGGYVAELKGNLDDVNQLLDELYEKTWLDKYTRAVFIEMGTFNAQVNLFGVVNMLAEFLPTGGVETSYRFDIIRLYTYAQGFGAVRLACEILFLIFMIFFIVREFNNMRREGFKKYFKSFWNCIEWFIIACAIGSVVVYFYRKHISDQLLEEFKSAGGQHRFNLQYVAYWNELLTYMIAIIVFIGSLKFIKLLRFNRRIGLLSSTIRSCFKDLVHFGIMFALFFGAYSLAFYQMYLRYLLDYSSFLYTMETLSAAVLGKFHYEDIETMNRYLGPILFFMFMVTITFVLVNMFLTIVIESFSKVKHDISRQSNDYEMVDFMLGRLKMWVGLKSKAKAEEKPSAPPEDKDVDPMTEFPDKVDQLLDGIAKVYFNASHFEEVIRGMGGTKDANTAIRKRPVKHAVTA